MQHTFITEFEKYLQEEKRVSTSTCLSYTNSVKGFLRVCVGTPAALFLPKDWEWKSLDKRALEVYLNHLRDDRGCKPTTLALHASALRAYFYFLQQRGELEHNPARSLLPRVDRKTPQKPEGDEEAVFRLFDRSVRGVNDARFLLLVELIYGGGLRVTPVAKTHTLSVDTQNNVVHLETPQEKLTIPMGESGMRRVEAYLTLREGVVGGAENAPFWVDSLGRSCSPAKLSREIRQGMERVGLDGGAPQLRQLSAKHFKERGGDTRSVQKLMGVKRLGSLDRYAPPTYQDIAKQVRRIHPRQELKEGE